jgi:hypothetical protein
MRRSAPGEKRDIGLPDIDIARASGSCYSRDGAHSHLK